LEVVTLPNPPARGKNRIRVTLKDAQGNAIDGAEVKVTFYMAAMPAMGMAAMRDTAALTEQGNFLYEGELDLESGGTWQVTAVASKHGSVIATRQFNLSATGGM
jgi:Cu(I)/Ag(I) efflux system membrane fusion protein/cobalt-zinc-cadmium efflux system membrane fusion protein